MRAHAIKYWGSRSAVAPSVEHASRVLLLNSCYVTLRSGASGARGGVFKKSEHLCFFSSAHFTLGSGYSHREFCNGGATDMCCILLVV